MADFLYFTVGIILGGFAFWYIERSIRRLADFGDRYDTEPMIGSVLCGVMAFGLVVFAWPFLLFVAGCITILFCIFWVLTKGIKYLYRGIEDYKFRRKQKKLDTK